MVEFDSRSEERAFLRRVARVLALKALFESDLSPHRAEEVLERMLDNLPVLPDAEPGQPSPSSDARHIQSLDWLPEDSALIAVERPELVGDEGGFAEPLSAASYGGEPDETAMVEAEPEPGIEDEAPAASGQMEPLTPEQAARVAAFARDLVRGVGEHLPAIDAGIAESAPQWPVRDLPAVDRNLLRIGLYEVLFARRTPVRVAINEAVDLASEYGGDASPRFVNGVLGAVARRYADRR